MDKLINMNIESSKSISIFDVKSNSVAVKDYRMPDQNQPREKQFLEFMQEFIYRKGKSDSWRKQYITVYHHIENYCIKFNCMLYTDSISELFLEDFCSYLQELGLMQNTIKGIIDRVKAVTKKAAIYGYMINRTYDEVSVKEEEVHSIYLTQNQITRIYYYGNLDKSEERIRDLFIVQCLTGLRFSDISNLNFEDFDFQRNLISKKTKKTGANVILPIHPFVKEIFEKYNGFIPNDVTIQHYNREIKKIAKKIGLTEKVSFQRTVGHEVETLTYEFWEMVSSHTARRSFLTNLYNSGQIKTLDIATLSGHKSETNLLKYIKVNKEQVASTIQGNSFFTK